jgi:hypothetical protein
MTRQWRKRRAMWAARLPMPCYRCGALITPDMAWHLDHTTPRSQGGHDADARPSHARCNFLHGNALGHERKRELIALGREVEEQRRRSRGW